MSIHPNFKRIAVLQAEIKRLSDEVASPILNDFFAKATFEDKLPNCSKLARANGVTQTFLSKRVHRDPRYVAWKTKQQE